MSSPRAGEDGSEEEGGGDDALARSERTRVPSSVWSVMTEGSSLVTGCFQKGPDTLGSNHLCAQLSSDSNLLPCFRHFRRKRNWVEVVKRKGKSGGKARFQYSVLTKRSNWGFIGTHPFVEGSEKFDVRLEVLSCLFEGLVI